MLCVCFLLCFSKHHCELISATIILCVIPMKKMRLQIWPQITAFPIFIARLPSIFVVIKVRVAVIYGDDGIVNGMSTEMPRGVTINKVVQLKITHSAVYILSDFPDLHFTVQLKNNQT